MHDPTRCSHNYKYITTTHTHTHTHTLIHTHTHTTLRSAQCWGHVIKGYQTLSCSHCGHCYLNNTGVLDGRLILPCGHLWHALWKTRKTHTHTHTDLAEKTESVSNGGRIRDRRRKEERKKKIRQTKEYKHTDVERGDSDLTLTAQQHRRSMLTVRSARYKSCLGCNNVYYWKWQLLCHAGPICF